MDSHGNVTEEQGVVRHNQYYFSLITFQVENCLFKLPLHFIQQSEVFQAMCAAAHGDAEEGICDQNPIYLAHILRKDFEAFLKAAIPLAEGGSRNALSYPEWLAVLELAHKWDFKNTRQIAIEALDEFPMDVVEQIAMIQKYDIKKWACAAYEKLMVRERSLTANEMKSLGFEFTSKMAEAREKVRMMKINGAPTAGGPSPWKCLCGRTNKARQSACASCGESKPSTTTDLTSIRDVIRVVFGDPVLIL